MSLCVFRKVLCFFCYAGFVAYWESWAVWLNGCVKCCNSGQVVSFETMDCILFNANDSIMFAFYAIELFEVRSWSCKLQCNDGSKDIRHATKVARSPWWQYTLIMACLMQCNALIDTTHGYVFMFSFNSISTFGMPTWTFVDSTKWKSAWAPLNSLRSPVWQVHVKVACTFALLLDSVEFSFCLSHIVNY